MYLFYIYLYTGTHYKYIKKHSSVSTFHLKPVQIRCISAQLTFILVYLSDYNCIESYFSTDFVLINDFFLILALLALQVEKS